MQLLVTPTDQTVLSIYASSVFPDGASLLGYVTCSGGDSGMMTIPQYLSSYPTWALVAVHLIRHKIELVPWLNKTLTLKPIWNGKWSGRATSNEGV